MLCCHGELNNSTANVIGEYLKFYLANGLRLFEAFEEEENKQVGYVILAILDVVDYLKPLSPPNLLENEYAVLKEFRSRRIGEGGRGREYNYVCDSELGGKLLGNFRPKRGGRRVASPLSAMAVVATTMATATKKSKLRDPIAALIHQGSLLIFEMLSYQRLKNLRLVSKSWDEFLGRGNDMLWKRVYEIKGWDIKIVHSREEGYYIDEFKRRVVEKAANKKLSKKKRKW